MSGYFFRDEFNGDFEEFDTIEEAFRRASDAIKDLDSKGGCPQEVLDGAFQVGIITHISSETNRRESDRDDEGEVINNEFDYLCDVEMIENKNSLSGKIETLEPEVTELKSLLKEARGYIEARVDNINLSHKQSGWKGDLVIKMEQWLKKVEGIK